MRQTRRGLLAAAGLFPFASALADSPGFPNRPLRLLVPFGAGGVTDITARVLADALGTALGQPVVPENRPGGAGNGAAEAMLAAPPDGHALLFTTQSTFSGLNSLLYTRLAYDHRRDFAGIAATSSTAFVVLVHPSVPAEDLAGVIAWVKARPGLVSFASAGSGTSTHLFGEMLNDLAGLDMLHVPYRQSANAMADLLAGRIQLRVTGVAEALPVIRSGGVRPVAVTSLAHSPLLPQVAPANDTLPGAVCVSWYGLAARAGTPAAVIARLNQAANAAIAQPALRARYRDLGAETMGGPPERMAALAAEDWERWAPLIRRAGVRAE